MGDVDATTAAAAAAAAFGMADFEQFIYFILRCACFSRAFFLRPAMLFPLDSLCVRCQ